MKTSLIVLAVYGVVSLGNASATDNEDPLCKQVASLADTGKIQYDHEGSIDINNDGEEEQVEYVDDGVPELAHYRMRNGELLALDSAISDMSDGWYWQHLKLDGQVYRVQCADPGCWAPSRLLRTDPNNQTVVACRFRQRYEERVIEGANLCQSLVGNNAAKYLTGKSLDFSDKRVNRAMSYPLELLQVDFDNDGNQDELIKVKLDNESRRPCSYTYFELLSPDRSQLELGVKRNALLALQQITDPETEVFPTKHCYGNDAGWLSLSGRIFFETKYSGQSPDALSQFHLVAQMHSDGSIEQTCRFEVSQRTESVNP